MEFKNPPIELPQREIIKNSVKVKENLGEYNELKSTYFVFMDVLGFKQTFSNLTKEIKSVFEYFNSLMSQLGFLEKSPGKCYAGQTSDSLYFYTTDLNYLVCFINVFLHFGLYAMSKNVFFRGGISKGTLYVNKPYQFYGDCVINSFLLEEDIAQMPRIAIDKKTVKDLNGNTQNWNIEEIKERTYLNFFSKSVLTDVDEYLDEPSAENQIIDLDFIKAIRTKITTNMTKLEFNDKTYQKYYYLKDSCDNFIKEIKNI